MNFGLELRLHHLRGPYDDRLLTGMTVLLLLFMFVLAPLSSSGIIVIQAIGTIVVVVLIASALIVSGSKTAFAVLLIAFFANLAVILFRALNEPSIFCLYLLASVWLIFAITLGWIVAHAVFGPGRVTYHRIIGAVFLYLLIALLFSAVSIFTGLIIPTAFAGLKIEDTPALTSQLFYFNFVTLTSTGYGDIVPVHPIARSMCNVETILGQFYPATLLARLVTLEVAGRS